MKERKEVLNRLDDQFKVCLNGDEARYCTSLEELRVETNEMSHEDIKLLRKALMKKLKKDYDTHNL